MHERVVSRRVGVVGLVRGLCGVLALAGVLVVVHGVDGGALSLPSPSPSSWEAWLDRHTPISASMALARAVGTGLGWYLVSVSALRLVGRSLRTLRLVDVSDRLTSPALRGLVRAIVGAGVAGAMATAPITLGAPAAVAAPPGVIGAVLDGSGAGSAEGAPTQGPQPTVDPSEDRGTPWHPVLGARRDAGPGAVAASTPSAGSEHVVRPGDSFWRISEEIVSAQLSRPATDAEIIDHWRRFVALNADRLVVPGEPDLIIEGQRLLLPTERGS